MAAGDLVTEAQVEFLVTAVAAGVADVVRSSTITRIESITHAAYTDPGFTPAPGVTYLVGPETP